MGTEVEKAGEVRGMERETYRERKREKGRGEQ